MSSFVKIEFIEQRHDNGVNQEDNIGGHLNMINVMKIKETTT